MKLKIFKKIFVVFGVIILSITFLGCSNQKDRGDDKTQMNKIPITTIFDESEIKNKEYVAKAVAQFVEVSSYIGGFKVKFDSGKLYVYGMGTSNEYVYYGELVKTAISKEQWGNLQFDLEFKYSMYKDYDYSIIEKLSNIDSGWKVDVQIEDCIGDEIYFIETNGNIFMMYTIGCEFYRIYELR